MKNRDLTKRLHVIREGCCCWTGLWFEGMGVWGGGSRCQTHLPRSDMRATGHIAAAFPTDRQTMTVHSWSTVCKILLRFVPIDIVICLKQIKKLLKTYMI